MTHTSLDVDANFPIESDKVVRAMFSGWARTAPSAPTRTRSRSSATIPTFTPRVFRLRLQEIRFADRFPFAVWAEPIRSPIWCSRPISSVAIQFNFLNRGDVLKNAAPGAVFLLNTSPY